MITDQLTEVIRLAGSEVRAAPSSIHDLRVGLKRVRAWVRLMRPALRAAGADPREIDRRLGDIGRLLSPSRDARVLCKTLRRIQARTGGKHRRRIETWRAELASRQEAAIPWDRVRAELALSAHLLHRVDWSVVGPEALLGRLAATYRRTRRLRERVLRDRNAGDEAFHDLRKSVKRLAYQVEYLDQLFELRHPRGAGFARAGQRLGEVNDLLILRQWLRAKGLKPGSRLAKLVDRRIRRRQRLARAQLDNLLRGGGRRFVSAYPPVAPRRVRPATTAGDTAATPLSALVA